MRCPVYKVKIISFHFHNIKYKENNLKSSKILENKMNKDKAVVFNGGRLDDFIFISTTQC
jgi:hypothetical protein